MKMINIYFSIRNPWATKFGPLKHYYGSFSKNKAWEVTFCKTSDLVGLIINITYQQDHAGLHFSLALFGYSLDISVYDCRHWNHTTKTWETDAELT